MNCTECKGQGVFKEASGQLWQCSKCRGTGHDHACSGCGIIDLQNDGTCTMCGADIPIRCGMISVAYAEPHNIETECGKPAAFVWKDQDHHACADCFAKLDADIQVEYKPIEVQ